MSLETHAKNASTLDDLAEMFRLPEWRLRGSAADFLDACADILGEVRDLSVPASDEWLALGGYTKEDYGT